MTRRSLPTRERISMRLARRASTSLAVVQTGGRGTTRAVGLTRFGGHLSVYREGVRNVEQGNEVSSGISQANGRIGLGRPQIRGPIQRVRPNGLDHPKMG